MDIATLRGQLDTAAVGREMHALVAELYPICRSITGHGVRATLDRIRRIIPITVHEVPSGTPVFDWTVPKEWNIRDAYVKNSRGERVIDFRASNLHVVSYSVPVRRVMSLSELRPHLFTLPDQPDRIPYRTTYYRESWGFCLRQHDLDRLEEGDYEVCIDSSLEPGHLTYGELRLPGALDDEILVSTHICHPSLCNDNLSGIALATMLARELSSVSRRYSYRFVFVPGTIGSITWLSRNEEAVQRVRHGLVLTAVGDAAPFTYKRSRRGNAEVDRVATHVLRHSGQPHRIIDFFPYGYDERQYCSPGFDLPVGCLMRSQHGTYPEYHTSADDLDFVSPDSLGGSLEVSLTIFAVLEGNGRYRNQFPKCEPQLGRRGLYRMIGGQPEQSELELALLWVLNLSDGTHTLLDIAERSGLPFAVVRKATDMLLETDLLREVDD